MIQAQKAGTSLVPSGWAQLAEVAEVAPAPVPMSSLTVEVGSCRVHVSADTDPALLAKVCGVLKLL